jgi:hypothetical protein
MPGGTEQDHETSRYPVFLPVFEPDTSQLLVNTATATLAHSAVAYKGA